MAVFTSLIHLADIKRVGHTIVSRKKATTESTVSTNVECRIMAQGDVPTLTLLGRTASEAFAALFPAATDLQVGDKVVWKNRTPNLVFMVEGVTEHSSGGYSDQDHHLEAQLKKMVVD